MIKKIIVGLTAILSIGMLAACGNETGDGNVTITYALWDERQAVVYQELADKFEEETGIHVEFQVTPWAQYWTQLETAITGGNMPDVFWMNFPRFPDYVEHNVLHPLTDININRDAFPEQHLETFSVDGELFAVPKDFDTHALYFNKTMFDEADLAHPDETWTWNEWKEAARILTDEDSGVWGFAARNTWQGGYYEIMLQNNALPFINNGTESGFSEDNAIEAIEFYHSFLAEGLSPDASIMAEIGARQLLANGQVAMAILGSYDTSWLFEQEYALENVDIAPLPKGVVRGTTSNSVAHVIGASTENFEAARAWIEFLSTEEAMRFVSQGAIVLPIYAGTQDGWFEAFPDKNIQVHIDALEYATPLPSYLNASAAIALEAEIFNRAWIGEITVREAAEEVARQANQILQR